MNITAKCGKKILCVNLLFNDRQESVWLIGNKSYSNLTYGDKEIYIYIYLYNFSNNVYDCIIECVNVEIEIS